MCGSGVCNLALIQSKNGMGSGKGPESPVCILVNIGLCAVVYLLLSKGFQWTLLMPNACWGRSTGFRGVSPGEASEEGDWVPVVRCPGGSQW